MGSSSRLFFVEQAIYFVHERQQFIWVQFVRGLRTQFFPAFVVFHCGPAVGQRARPPETIYTSNPDDLKKFLSPWWISHSNRSGLENGYPHPGRVKILWELMRS